MPQPASIIEWWGPYNTLVEVRDDVRSDGFRTATNSCAWQCTGDSQERGIQMPAHHRLGTKTIMQEIELPAECHQNDDGDSIFYLGWIASHYPNYTRAAAEWALIRELQPMHNGEPAPPPRGVGSEILPTASQSCRGSMRSRRRGGGAGRPAPRVSGGREIQPVASGLAGIERGPVSENQPALEDVRGYDRNRANPSRNRNEGCLAKWPRERSAYNRRPDAGLAAPHWNPLLFAAT